jgi:hypothetical protein
MEFEKVIDYSSGRECRRVVGGGTFLLQHNNPNDRERLLAGRRWLVVGGLRLERNRRANKDAASLFAAEWENWRNKERMAF